MKNNTISKLRLSRETLRTLATTNLEGVVGGVDRTRACTYSGCQYTGCSCDTTKTITAW